MLQRWWSKKYNLPWNHELFQDRTVFDLLVEFELDYFEENPLEVHRNEDGHIQFKNTGDDLIDRWENQIAKGDEPSYEDMLTPEVREKIERLRSRGRARSSIGGTFKNVVDGVERDAQRQGLGVPSTTGVQRRPQRSNFGSGTD